ncbi:sensor domain-containing protein [Rhodococcus sp. ABRD24]|nr:sensor domain-containing protein [Rhodococcus sp. ABRD24]
MVVASAALLAAGCSTEVSGTARPEMGSSASGTSSRTLGELLLEPEAFPPRYQAVILPPQAVAQAAPDLTGIPPNAKVHPAGCKPSAQDYGPDGTAMVVGTDNADRSTLTVELIRATAPLAELEAQIAQCPEVTVTLNAVDSVVRTDLTRPPASVDADTTVALRRSVTSGRLGKTVIQSMRTLITQIDGVRIQVTHMSFGDVADPSALDAVFTAVVQKVRAG